MDIIDVDPCRIFIFFFFPGLCFQSCSEVTVNTVNAKAVSLDESVNSVFSKADLAELKHGPARA